MDKVLVVDEDPVLLEKLKESSSRMRQFDVVSALDGKQALDILSGENISVLVTDINAAKVGGLELLAHVTREHPGMPCIVMSSYGKPWFHNSHNRDEVLYHVEKPLNMASLLSAIFVGLTLRDENEAEKGISLRSLLPLIEAGRKTCRLEISAPEKGKGYLYFHEGALIDAHRGNLDPEAAVTELLDWTKIRLKIGELPKRRGVKRVRAELMEIAGADWNKDAVVKDRESEEADGSAFSDPAAEAMKSRVGTFRIINGYKSVGILDERFNPVACDFADAELDLKSLVAGFKPVLSLCSEVACRNGLSECRMFTFHTSKAVIQILRSEPENFPPFYLVGIVETAGNWFFMKFELENLQKHLAERLGKNG